MAQDPYAILGVPRTASDDEIRKAFRKLAKENHPDLFPGDNQAAERFKKFSAAYDILGDAEKRRQFDRGEIDASGEPRRAYQYGHAGARRPGAGGPHADAGFNEAHFGDIFNDLFGGPRPGHRGGARGGFGMRGPDIRYTLEVDFLEAVNGAKKRVTLPDGGILDLTVPEGVGEGQVLRLKGKGSPGHGGAEAGDALVEIRVRPHPQFKRINDDIHLELPISIDEAVLGEKIEVPTVTGKVQLSIPKATSSGRVFRLRGKGVRTASGGHGDQLVTVRIVLPEKIDDGLSYFLSEWRQKNRYDPRKG